MIVARRTRSGRAFVSPLDFGPVDLTGKADATATVQAAILASLSYGVPAVFPAGTYKLSSTIAISPGTSVDCDAGAIWDFTGAAGDGVQLLPGFHSPWAMRFGVIRNAAAGAGLNLYGAQQATVRFQYIQGCQDGVKLSADAANTQCSANDVGGLLILSTTNGVVVSAAVAGDDMQLNKVRVVQIDFCTNGLVFSAPNGVNPNWTFNLFELEGIAGENAAGSTGITAPNGNQVSNCTILCRNFFSQFASHWINLPSCSSNWIELKCDPTLSTPGDVVVLGESNYVVNTNYAAWPAALNSAPIAMATASGSRGTWNGGVLVTTRRTHCSVTVGALTAGQTADFYMYHAFLTGLTGAVSASPRWTAAMMIIAVEDESEVAGVDGQFSANQLHVRVMATGAVSAGTYNLDIVVEG